MDTQITHGKGGIFRLPMNIAERLLFLMGFDLLFINAALVVALLLQPRYQFGLETLVKHPLWFLVLIFLWILLAWTFDVYNPGVSGRLSTSVLPALKAGFFTAVFYLIISLITPSLFPKSRLLLFAFPLLLLVSLTLGRGLYVLLFSQLVFPRRVLIVGAGWAGRTIAEVLVTNGNYEVIGFVDDDPVKQGTQLQIAESTLSVLGDRSNLRNLIPRLRIDTLVLAITRNIDAHLLQVLIDCLELGVEVIPMPILYEELTGRVPIEHVGDNWYVALPLNHPQTRPLNRMLKRTFDIVAATFGVFFLAPLFPFIALAIYIDSRGPIFYTQQRVGQGGRTFKIYKFRTMVPEAEKGGPIWAQEHDPRVTRVGRILRKTHIDEFPQFINILKGEMSAVGPRPERPEFVEELTREIPFYRIRHAVKPGMAGWGLVRQGYGASKEDALLKLQYDLYYIKHQSLWLDLVILLKTIVDTLTFRGRA